MIVVLQNVTNCLQMITSVLKEPAAFGVRLEVSLLYYQGWRQNSLCNIYVYLRHHTTWHPRERWPWFLTSNLQGCITECYKYIYKR